jgi:hypothetical protein
VGSGVPLTLNFLGRDVRKVSDHFLANVRYQADACVEDLRGSYNGM